MESNLICEIDSQLTYLQNLTQITEGLKEKCKKLESDKNEAIKNYETVRIKLERLSQKKCTNCSFLANELKKERNERDKLKKVEKAKLLKTIARTLESLEDGNTNHVNQILTELNYDKLNESPEQKKEERRITLIEDMESCEDVDESKILVNETIMIDEHRGVSVASKDHTIIIPETEAMECPPPKTAPTKLFKAITLPKLKNCNSSSSSSKENVDLTGNFQEDDVIEQVNKKSRLSPILSSQNVSPPRDKMQINQSFRSPSVLSEIIEAAGGSSASSSGKDEKGIAWKMKPGVVKDDATTSAPGGKKLKQMTLSLTRMEKKTRHLTLRQL